MRGVGILSATCATAMLIGAPAMADSGDSLNKRAEAAALAAKKKTSARVSSSVANAAISYLVPLRVPNSRIGSNFGFRVVDSATGEALYDRQSTKPMLPASNMKIITAITALTVLGPDHRMTTDAIVPAKGTVILRGGGDTMLNTTQLAQLAADTADELEASGLLPDPKVPGGKRPALQVYVDDSLYGTPKTGPGWTSSYQPYIVRPVRPLGRLGVYRTDSALEAGQVFAKALTVAGVRAKAIGHQDAAAGSEPVASVQSARVSDQVKYMMQVSENNIAEMLFRQVAVASGLPGTFKGGRLAALQTLQGLGLDTAGAKLRDGSGLSRTDRLTPKLLTDTLALALDTTKYPRLSSFLNSLPIGGRTGTLASSMGRYSTWPSRCAAGQVFAKTGSLFDTIGLSGYVRGQDGQMKIFAALVNDRPQRYSQLATRQAVDGLVATVNGCWKADAKTGQPPTS